MPLRLALIALVVSGLAACSQFPDLDDRVSPEAERADYPEFLPLEQLVTPAPGMASVPDATQPIEARVAALRVRAERLQGTVIDRSTRTRMTAGVPQI